MRECWINVYPNRRDPRGGPGPFMPRPVASRAIANENACGSMDPKPGDLRRVGVGYRLHVRLKPDRLDGLEDMARQMMTSPNQVTANHGAMRLRMIQAARAKGVR